MPTRRPPAITSNAPMLFCAIRRTASTTGASGAIAWTSGDLFPSSCRTVCIALSRTMDVLRYCHVRRQPGVNQVQRTLFDFHVQASEVFADQAQRDQLHAAQK